MFFYNSKLFSGEQIVASNLLTGKEILQSEIIFFGSAALTASYCFNSSLIFPLTQLRRFKV